MTRDSFPFGATGRGAMSTQNVATPQASYFAGSHPSTTTSFWDGNTIIHDLRFVVKGTIIPEPSAIALAANAAFGVIGLMAGRRS